MLFTCLQSGFKPCLSLSKQAFDLTLCGIVLTDGMHIELSLIQHSNVYNFSHMIAADISHHH